MFLATNCTEGSTGQRVWCPRSPVLQHENCFPCPDLLIVLKELDLFGVVVPAVLLPKYGALQELPWPHLSPSLCSRAVMESETGLWKSPGSWWSFLWSYWTLVWNISSLSHWTASASRTGSRGLEWQCQWSRTGWIPDFSMAVFFYMCSSFQVSSGWHQSLTW